MITLPFLNNQSVAVLGLGKSGAATVDALCASGANVVAWDDGGATCDGAVMAPPSAWDWDALDLMVLAPGIPYTHPEPHEGVKLAQQHGVEIVGDVELFRRAKPDATVIAITGTNGKSTTTSLIGHLLQQAGCDVQVGGNLGVPVLALSDADMYVLELSSYQLDLVRSTRFDVAVWLNISPDHLDRHGGLDGYIAAKHHIFDRQGADDVAIVGVDDPASEAVCHGIIADGAQQIVPVMTTQRCEQGVWVEDAILHAPMDAVELDLSGCVTLKGEHNHQNAAAAYAACRAVGMEPEAIANGLGSYPGLAHRMQRVAEVDGVLFVNDSKATNADAAAKSLDAYDAIYWIAGGVAKAGGIESLGSYFPKVRHAFLIGQAQDDFANTLDGHVDYARCASLDDAVMLAADTAKAQGGGVVLLAPACASFDQFANFEVRGDAFVQAVQQWEQRDAA